MAEADRYLTPSQKSKLQGVRSNTIVNESSGTRIFHVEEWLSGDKYRLDQTANSPINATYLKSHPNGYRDTYVNIRDPVFSPYSAFSVNHNLRDAQLTKDPKMKYLRVRPVACVRTSRTCGRTINSCFGRSALIGFETPC